MKKCFILFIFSNILLFSQNPPFNGNGDGSEYYPFQIYTKEHLKELADSTISDNAYGKNPWHRGKYFQLMDNILDTVKGSEIIFATFSGHFNGNGKKIIVEIVYDPNDIYSTPFIFPAVEYGASINDLTLEGYIPFTMISANFGTISNCINNATIDYSGVINPITGKLEWPAGGIAYTNSGTISNCINNGDITGVDRIGGITGENSGTIINCINNGTITATASGDNNIFSGVGGIVGTAANGCVGILNCVNLGSVVGQGFVGGIVGLVRGMPPPTPPTPITNCINYGYVQGINGVGGILGYMFNQYVNVTNCVNVGVVEGEEYIGSIVGKE